MIYCVVGKDLRQLVEQNINADDRIDVGEGEWLIHSEASTCKAVWEQIVSPEDDAIASDEPQPTGIVTAVRGYYGYHHSTVWEWLSSKRMKNGD